MELLEMRRILEESAACLAAERMGEVEAQKLKRIVDEMRSIGNQKDFSQDFAYLLNLDDRLHRLIVDSSRNNLLKRFWEQVNVRFRATANRYRRTEQELFDAITDHGEIADALLAGDVATAQSLMRAHVERARELLLQDLALQE
jgi:DNA-binding GntR family transcriptional regulator